MSLAEVLASVQKSLDIRKEAIIGGIPFELSILTLYEEQKISALSVEDKDPLQYVADLRKQLLSYSIKKVKGEEVPDVVKSTVDGKELSEERPIYLRSFLDKLPGSVVESLFDVYVDLKEESESSLKGTLKYSWFKTPEVRDAEREAELKKQEEASKKQEETSKNQEEEDIILKPLPKSEDSETPGV